MSTPLTYIGMLVYALPWVFGFNPQQNTGMCRPRRDLLQRSGPESRCPCDVGWICEAGASLWFEDSGKSAAGFGEAVEVRGSTPDEEEEDSAKKC